MGNGASKVLSKPRATIKVITGTPSQPPPSQEEVEARLHQEGYESYKWYDVPGVNYPTHRHAKDECLWILKGELVVTIDGQEYRLQAGDRIYLLARTPHTATVPNKGAVTYVVGQKSSTASAPSSSS